jgi:Ca2+-binding RTX toxin-like protein
MALANRALLGAIASLTVLGGASALPGAAEAATVVSSANQELSVRAATGRLNAIRVSGSAGVYTVTDSGDTVQPGASCAQVDPHTARCTDATLTRLRVSASDLADTIANAAPLWSMLNGDDGNDTIGAEPAATRNDMYGGAGNDTVNGGPGFDNLDGGTGADDLNGGGGDDAAVYNTRTSGVTVSIDGVANDGAPGEGDDVATDVEDVFSGSGNDTLIGSAGSNYLSAGAGDDTIRGGAGDDRLVGVGGDDVLDGGVGADVFAGGIGRDRADYAARAAALTIDIDGFADDGAAGEGDNVNLDVENVTGGARNDVITGSASANSLVGGAGSDRLYGVDGDDDLDTTDWVFGNDYLRGGNGVDSCDFDDGDHAFTCG